MALNFLASRLFANFGLWGTNIEGLQENGEKFEQGNGDIEDDLINMLVDEDHISKLPDEDRLSTLPDDILFIIMSFLTLRDVFKASTLSRRWRNLCASMSDVNFDMEKMFGWNGDEKKIREMKDILEGTEICPKNRGRFVEGVSRFLKLYMGPKLHSFRVSFCFDAKFTSCVDAWISLAVRVGVEKLDLNFVCRDYFFCDHMYDYQKMKYYRLCWQHLFGAFNLKHLRLHSCIVLPDSSCKMGGLTMIDLNYVPLARNELQHIFRNCLNLEWLKVRGCRLPDKLCVSGLAGLKYLAVDTCPGLKEMELNAINLTFFEFCDCAIKKLSFSCVPKLETVFFCLQFSGALPYIFGEVASKLPQLKALWISTSTLWVKEIGASPYVLSNVKQLELFIGLDHGFHLVKIIAPLLRAFPLLERLNLVVSHHSLP